MNSSLLLSIATFVFGFAAFLYAAASVFKKQLPAKLAWWITIAAALFTASGITMRWIESYKMGIGHAPLSNMYESLVFFSFTLGCIHVVYEKKYQNPAIGSFAAPIAFLAIAYASLAPGISDRIQPLIPALKSNWLIAHVVTCFLGYAAFAIAFGVSILYLINQGKEGDTQKGHSFFPKSAVLEELNHQMVMFGFLFLTVGIITGSVWANSAWGSYWSWDPKETWSLITWFIYATLLHARMMRGWDGRRIAWISVLGFAAVLFTYFGVNYLPGLHSYAQS